MQVTSVPLVLLYRIRTLIAGLEVRVAADYHETRSNVRGIDELDLGWVRASESGKIGRGRDGG
jgi:hypothetical protein